MDLCLAIARQEAGDSFDGEMKDGSWQRWQVTDDAVTSSSCSPTRAPNISVCHRGPSVTETIPEPHGSPNPLDGNLERDDMGGVLDSDMVGTRQGKSSTHVPGRAIRAGQHLGGGRKDKLPVWVIGQ